MRKAVGLVLAMLAGLTLVAWASGATEQQGSQGPGVESYLNVSDTYPFVKPGQSITLKIYCPAGNYNVDPKDHWIWSHLKQNANLNVDVRYFDPNGWAEQKNLIFASKDLPDVFYNAAFTRDEIVRYGQLEGMFYDMKGLITKYAPLVRVAFGKYPDAEAACTTPDGKVYTLPVINNGDEEFLKSTSRVFIHKTWLDKLGLKNPETLDQLTSVLTAIKNRDPNGNGKADEVPLVSTYEKGYSLESMVLTALGINSNTTRTPYLRSDGKVGIPFLDPQYVEYLKYVRMLLNKGLLNQDYFTATADQAKAKMASDVVGVAAMAAPFVEVPEHFKDYDSLNVLTSQANSTKTWPLGASRSAVGNFTMGYTTKYPELGMRFANAHFTDDGAVLWWTGQYDGYRYNIAGWGLTKMVPLKDNPTFGEVILPAGDQGIWDSLLAKIRPYYGGQPIGYADYTGAAERLWNLKRMMIVEEKTWRGSYEARVQAYVKPILPDLYYTPDKLDRKTALETPILDYLKSAESKFLIGTMSIDDIAAFQNQMKSLGATEYLGIIQQAYDAYKAASSK